MMLEGKRILITGGSGLVGRHLRCELESRAAVDLVCPRSAEFDLRRAEDVTALFRDLKPHIVFSLAAKVGGILDNKNYPADFYYDNILIGAHTFDACARWGVEKLINIGAGCGYPVSLQEPLREEEFWDGFPQPESAPYSLAKKMLVIQGIAYRQQHGLRSITVIPSNLYGEYDNFDLDQAHVIPALVRKFYEAKASSKPQVEVWGDGSAKRDFIHTADFASALVEAAADYDGTLPINVAYGTQHSIKDVVTILMEISGYAGEIFWDLDRPSGQHSREMSLDNIRRHVPKFRPRIDLKSGLTRTYRWLEEYYGSGTARL
ncbi:MAG: NAD-dependent epimerase/dehydratase family protein [Alphaproteobacteria bacterium]|nr:NAD-dependent epimerase/dehydratase family protein [Alphaproteobacteria bacterium]